jgi:DNA-binding MarR family transcriptional regulator
MHEALPDGVPEAGADVRSLHQDLHWCLVRLARGLGAMEVEAVRLSGISVRSYVVLLALGDQGADSQFALARAAMLDKSTLVRALDELELAGCVVRRSDPRDRRVRTIVITERGREVRARATAAVAEVEERFLATLPARQRRAFRMAASTLGTGPSAGPFDSRSAAV